MRRDVNKVQAALQMLLRRFKAPITQKMIEDAVIEAELLALYHAKPGTFKIIVSENDDEILSVIIRFLD